MINRQTISKTGSKNTMEKSKSASTSAKHLPITSNPALRNEKDIELNEEWSNFMQRVGQVSTMVKDMASGDEAKAAAANKLADKFLEGKVILDEDVEATVKDNRTVINKNAYKTTDNNNSNEIDKDAWMAEMSRDAARRAEDRKVRLEKADTQKTMAVKAYRRGDYERALSCYNRAIEHVRDNAMFYCDRALTNIKLERFDKVDADCDMALRINENSYKARLYRAKAHLELESEKYEEFRKELQDTFPQHEELTSSYLKKSDGETEQEDEED